MRTEDIDKLVAKEFHSSHSPQERKLEEEEEKGQGSPISTKGNSNPCPYATTELLHSINRQALHRDGFDSTGRGNQIPTRKMEQIYLFPTKTYNRVIPSHLRGKILNSILLNY